MLAKPKMESTNSTSAMIYPPLNNPGSQIRLLEATKDGSGAGICWKLSTFSLVDRPRFTALSYVWGSPVQKEHIDLDLRMVAVTANLASALSYSYYHWSNAFLRPRRYPFRLWADALCINQADLEEKNQQIPLMGTIFSSAELVISWLGPENLSVHLGIDTIDLLHSELTQLAPGDTSLLWILRHQSLSHPPNNNQGNYDHGRDSWDAVSAFTNLEYWHRAWVFQEVVLARRAIVTCGSKAIEWSKVANVSRRMLELRATLKRDPASMPSFISTACWVAIATRDGPSWMLLDAYARAAKSNACRATKDDMEASWELSILGGRRLKASNPKDSIYALLGISKIRIIPDYSQRTSIAAVYRDYVTTWLEDWKAGNGWSFEELTILIGSGCALDPSGTLPSWAPNYPALADRLGQKARDIYNGEADHNVFPAGTPNSAIVDMGLFISAVHLDTIVRTEICDYDEYFSPSTIDFLAEFISKSEEYPNGISSLQALIQLFLRDTWVQQKTLDAQLLQKALVILRIIISGNYNIPGGFGNYKKALLRLGISAGSHALFSLSFSEAFGLLFSSVDDAENLQLLFIWYQEISDGKWGGNNSYASSAVIMDVLEELLICRHMVLFTTSSGYIGICRPGVKVRDRVCVFKGSGVLWILRNMDDANYFVNVSSCHVVGLMNGEAAEFLGQKPVERFEVR